MVGISDPLLHQVPGAIIQPAKGVEPPSVDALKRHVRDHLPSPHVPAHWRFVEAMPLNSAYKLDRAALGSLFAGIHELDKDGTSAA